ncbi:cyclic nucleotide-binding [Chlorella sorokiniana]|uniref:Cyclic nucleotide-binding n=1 Tax=Chlorella sorokiniana TaxID=3076 RepID=A0A2P6TUS3_CHLSO|nr:cyclic nucleotide-binding [Chlorella sorokiniana]|eukprot:PRW57808.1 cyclic nucleotide-binding [Chlorella sorokiniana]
MPPLWKALVSSTPPAGVELPAESVAPVPSRTWLCDSRTFKRLQATGRSNFVISPVGLLASFTYSVANVTDLTYTAFVVALSVAFNDNGMSMDAGAGTCWLTIADLVGSIIYLIDLWMGFQLGIIARWEGRAVVVQNWAASARFYTRCGTFWTDMLACLPIFAQVAVATTGSSAQLLRLIATLRLLRLIRVVRLLANLSRSSVGGSHMRVLASAVTTRKLLLLHAVFSLAVLVNLLGCIWWNVAVGEGLDNSWAAAVNKDFDLLTAGEPTQWLVSCYFALTTIVTVGYGDIVPVTVKEVAMTMAFQVVGVAMFAYLLNTASSLLAASGPAAKRVEAIRNKLDEVESTMGALEFAPGLRRRIRRYFALAWEPPDGCAAHLPQLYAELPPALRHKLAAQQLRPQAVQGAAATAEAIAAAVAAAVVA